MGVFCKPLKFVSLLFILIRKTSLYPSGCHNLKFYRLSTWNTATKKCNCKRCKSVQQPMAASADRTVLGERRGLVENQVRLPIRETVKTGTPSNVQPQSPGESSLLSRRSYRLDYRLEEEVTRSCRDKHGRWANPWPNWQFPSYAMLLRFLLMDKDHSNVPTDKEVLDRELPVMEPYFVKNPVLTGQTGTGPVAGSGGSSSSGLKVTWLGHASVLVEIDGLTVLTDPIFSQRASAVQFMGPKRYRGPPCTVEQLPRVDAVLISHNHYDHLDLGTVASLNRRFGAALRWFAPMGLLSWLQRSGCENVIELDWWEENCVPGHNDVTFVCTPAQHWCKRTPLDDNMVLWGSWSVLGPKHRFFFAGDTGYCPTFQEIGRRFGPFDLAAIPIGAYQPRDVMKGQHVDPEEAVMIHKDVQAKRSVAIHWGTFALAHEYYLEPPLRLREALEKKGLTTDEFFTLNHGETRLLISEEVPSDKIV